MARVEISETVFDGRYTGLRPLSGASVQVNLRGSTAATVYDAATGTTTLANPLTTGSTGRIEGWLEEGSYDLVVSASGITTYTQPFEAAAGVTSNKAGRNSVARYHGNALSVTCDARTVPGAGALALTSGTLYLAGVSLNGGDIVTGGDWFSGGTSTTLTQRWYALYSPALAKLAVTGNDTTAWATNAYHPLNFASPYTVLTDGLYYLGICEQAATPISIRGIGVNATLMGLLGLVGTSTTGLTNAASAPATAAAITGVSTLIHGRVY